MALWSMPIAMERLREYDEILSRQLKLQQRMKEVHPKVCFRTWTGTELLWFYRYESAYSFSRRSFPSQVVVR